MWFGFGLITLLVAFGISVWVRLKANWRGEPRTLDGGRQYRLGVLKNKGRVTSVKIGVAVPASWDFAVRPEKAHDLWFKRIGISAEIETGDRRFDEAMYIVSDDVELGRLLRSRPAMRDALLAAFDYVSQAGLKATQIRCVHGQLWVVLAPDAEPAPERAAAALVPLLHVVGEELRHHPRAASKERDPFVLRAALLLSVSTASAIYGAIGLIRAGSSHDVLDAGQLFLWTVVPSLAALALFLVAIVAILGRSSRTHLVLLEALVVSAFGFVLTGHQLAREVNTVFDTGRLQRVEVSGIETVHTTSRSRKGGTTHHYRLYVDDWRSPGHRRMQIDIDSDLYRRLENGGTAAIYVRPGTLGFEWIERVEPVAARPPG